jgi:hypothetical protein
MMRDAKEPIELYELAVKLRAAVLYSIAQSLAPVPAI